MFSSFQFWSFFFFSEQNNIQLSPQSKAYMQLPFIYSRFLLYKDSDSDIAAQAQWKTVIEHSWLHNWVFKAEIKINPAATTDYIEDLHGKASLW